MSAACVICSLPSLTLGRGGEGWGVGGGEQDGGGRDGREALKDVYKIRFGFRSRRRNLRSENV